MIDIVLFGYGVNERSVDGVPHIEIEGIALAASNARRGQMSKESTGK